MIPSGAALRDALLPKLISGELRIGDAAARSEEACATMDSRS